MVVAMPRPKKTDAKKYNEKKRNFTIMLTETANELLEEASQRSEISRSEIVEMLIRSDELDSIR